MRAGTVAAEANPRAPDPPAAGRPGQRTAEVVFCIPIFNDWQPASLLLEGLGAVAGRLGGSCRVVFVDDGSTSRQAGPLSGCGAFTAVEILRLRRRLGHQRAIAVGLACIRRHRPCGAVVVMDGDGQDAAQDVPELLARSREGGSGSVVFARRTVRAEGLAFRLAYRAYRALHLLLTGLRSEVGNFSVLPFPLLERLVAVPELWNHYAAAVVHAGLPVADVPVPRGRRLSGRSGMTVTGLLMHGLSAISVHATRVGIRLLVFSGLASLAAVAGSLAVAVAAAPPRHLPVWVPMTAALLVTASLLLLAMSLLFVILVLMARRSPGANPSRDWEDHVLGLEALCSPAGDEQAAGRG